MINSGKHKAIVADGFTPSVEAIVTSPIMQVFAIAPMAIFMKILPFTISSKKLFHRIFLGDFSSTC